MASTTFTIELHTDGRHVVTISDDDPVRIQEQLAHAKGIFLKLQDLARQQSAAAPASDNEDPPDCAVHTQPMVLVKGRKGLFWSCHARNEDGSWCTVTRESAR